MKWAVIDLVTAVISVAFRHRNKHSKTTKNQMTNSFIKDNFLYYTAAGKAPQHLRKYVFEIRQSGYNDYRAYIKDSPSYEKRCTSTHDTHRNFDKGEYYVDWSTAIKSTEEAEMVAKFWADLNQQYIETGARF